MHAQVIKEIILVSTVLCLALIAIYRMRNQSINGSKKAEIVLTGFLGGLFLLAGDAKFFMPFSFQYAEQIRLSGLPFPSLAHFSGQAGEIFMGLSFFSLSIFRRRISQEISEKLFYCTHLALIITMLVAVYVHLQPDVPAQILPFGIKPPYFPIVIFSLSVIDILLHRKVSLLTC